MNYSIAIPSHNRLEIIQSNVLSFLKKHNIPNDIIYIFVSKEEIDNYKVLEHLGYNLCLGQNGIAKQREAISNYFDEDQFVVSIDDDVKDLCCGSDKHSESIVDLNTFILYIVAQLINKDLTLCGLYPTNNSYFFRMNETDDLRFCIGQFKVFKNKRFLEKRDYNLLEDYENTIKHFDFSGGVLRINYVGIKANYKSLAGGLYDYRTEERKIKEVDKFVKQYPSYSRKKKKPKDEVALLRNAVRETVSSLWIGNQLNYLSEVCMLSWLKQGYNIDLYIDFNGKFKLPKSLLLYAESLHTSSKAPVINLKDANKIMDTSDAVHTVLPFSDLWRFKLIYKTGATWLDADMFLINKLPNDPIIISAENTMQSGAFKSFKHIIPNIGVLRFPKGDEELKKIIDKIEKRKKVATFCDNMKIFRKEIVKTSYPLSDPSIYMPVDWWNYQSMYHHEIYKTKFDVEPMMNTDILEKSIGIHCWNNFTYGGNNRTAIDFDKIHKHSLFSKLLERL